VTKLSVLIVDDNVSLNKAVVRYLQGRGCEALSAAGVGEARRLLDGRTVDLMLVDYSMPDGTGAELVEWALPRRRAQVAYCITGVAITANVVAAMRAGCRDVIEKPFDLARLDPLIAGWDQPPEAIDAWRARFAPDVLGEDLELVRALSLARDVAESPSTVLITGESGTGKELFARAIHAASRRRGSFVALNCAALPENLIEAELFGHARGAFTGAAGARAGHILAADGGTLFLDEIGDMPLAAQARLLRALQEKQITPVGADEPVNVDVRVLAATHKNLEELVDQGKFREDLFFRISVIPLPLPPLRDRPDDVLLLARGFLARRAKPGQPLLVLSADAEQALVRHPWPGNVRELAHAMERASLLAKKGVIGAEDLGGSLRRRAAAGEKPASKEEPSLNLRAAIDTVERELIQKALEKTAGNRTEAAALLGLNRTTLVEKLRKLE
jgi:DNA-binding NtrC family response regulator